MKKRKFTEEEVKKLKKYWKQLQALQEDFDFAVRILEDTMQRNVKIKDVEFFMCVGDYVGIGNIARNIELIQQDELE